LSGIGGHARKGDLMPLMQFPQQLKGSEIPASCQRMQGAGFHPQNPHDFKGVRLRFFWDDISRGIFF
jgi:hypothetical protein